MEWFVFRTLQESSSYQSSRVTIPFICCIDRCSSRDVRIVRTLKRLRWVLRHGFCASSPFDRFVLVAADRRNEPLLHGAHGGWGPSGTATSTSCEKKHPNNNAGVKYIIKPLFIAKLCLFSAFDTFVLVPDECDRTSPFVCVLYGFVAVHR